VNLQEDLRRSTGRDRDEREVRPLEADRSLSELFGQLGEDVGLLLSTQVELTKHELREEVRATGKGAGMLGAAGMLGYLALTLLCFAAAWGLAEVWEPGVAFLVVGLVVGLAAAIVAMAGKQQLDEAHPDLPETQRSLKEDVQWTKRQLS